MKGVGFGLVLAGLVAIGCGDSGQTGSLSCKAEGDCACRALGGRTLVQATVISVDHRSDQTVVHLDLERVLKSFTLDESDLHRTLPANLSWGKVCINSVDPSVGDSVIAAVLGFEHCPAYPQCLERNCSDVSSFDACASSCEAQCIRSQDPLSLWIQPWADTVDVGEAAPITIDDAIELTNREQCRLRYPLPPNPCNDLGADSSCSVSDSAAGKRGTSGNQWLIVAGTLLAFGALRLRLVRRALFRALAHEPERSP